MKDQYVGVATRLKLVQDASENIIDLVDFLYGYADTTPSKLPPVVLEYVNAIHRMTNHASSFFSAWYWQERRFSKLTHGLTYETRASTLTADTQLFHLFLESIQDSLAIEEGEILFRRIEYDGAQEEIIYLEKGVLKIGSGQAYTGGRKDERHPANFEAPFTAVHARVDRHVRLFDPFVPPWTKNPSKKMLQFDPRMAAKNTEKQFTKKYHYNGSTQ